MANLEKFGQFLTALAMQKPIGTFCKIWLFFGHLLVCHCKIKFSLNILSYCIFLDGIHVTHCCSNAVAIHPFLL